MKSTKNTNQTIYRNAEYLVDTIARNSYADDVTLANECMQGLEKIILGWIKSNDQYFKAHKEEALALKRPLRELKKGYKDLAREQIAHQKTPEYKKALDERPNDEILTPEEAEFSQQIDIINTGLKDFTKNLKKTMRALEAHEQTTQKSR